MIRKGPRGNLWRKVDSERLGAILETGYQPLKRRHGWESLGDHGVVALERVWSNGRMAWRWGLYRYRDRGARAYLSAHHPTLRDAQLTATVSLGMVPWMGPKVHWRTPGRFS